jgi:hypothetical protein
VFKKFAAAAAALLVGAGLSFVAVAAPASAHHADLSATAACAPGGGWDITWSVVNSENFEGQITTSNNASVPEKTTLPANPGYNTSKSTSTTFVQHVDTKAPVKLEITVKWFRDSGTVTDVKSTTFSAFPSGCGTPKDSVDCVAATVYTGEALTNGDHINMEVTQDGVKFQTNAQIDIRQSYDPASESGLVIRIHQKVGKDITLPITNAQKASGIFTFTYSSYLTGIWTVNWVQFDTHDTHFTGSLTCGEPKSDAAAAVSTSTASCDAAATLTLLPGSYIDWGTPVYTAGPNGTTIYTVVATAKSGHTFPAEATVSKDGLTKTFTDTLAAKLGLTDCSDLATPVTPDLVFVEACGTYGDVTPIAATGVKYTRVFDSATGGYTVTATPEADYYFIDDQDGADDQTITYSGSVGAFYVCETDPNASAVYGVCVYSPDATADDRTATITYDNRASNTPVAFSGIAGHDQTVPAGELVTFDILVGPEGASYTVTAGEKQFPVQIDPCADYPEPKVIERQVPTEKFVCGSNVEISTITYTTAFEFDPTIPGWVAQPETHGDPVLSERAPTAEESLAYCATTVDTDPRASACGVDDPETDLLRWVYVDHDPSVVYTITNAVTGATVVASSDYTEVDAGKYLVSASAAPGYVLTPTAVEEWTLFVEDASACDVPDLAIVYPTYSYTPLTCTAAGSYTVGAIDPGTITWTTEAGDPVSDGKHEVTSAQTVTLVAAATNEEDGLDDTFINPVVITFTAPSTDCDDDPIELATLAFTGSNGQAPYGLVVLAGALGLLGVGGLLIARRRWTAASER